MPLRRPEVPWAGLRNSRPGLQRAVESAVGCIQGNAQAARRGLAAAREAVLGGAFDVVVLDEANVADSLGYFEPDALVDLALERPETVELVVTGRGASGTLMAVADLVTEMREVKHYYEEGVIARRGIEF